MGKKILLASVLGLLIFSVSLALSFAWFAIADSIAPDVSGDAVTGYFKSGNGTPEDPYIIETATHVYNLAWLQYMGLLNQKTTDSEGNPIITQYYFKISDEIEEIDMEGVVIPPIGTSEFPFVGHFDGNGKCIANLTVSNYLADGEHEFGIEKRPLSVTEITGEKVSIVGFFGVVGALDEETKAMLANDSEEEIIENKVNAVYNLFLDNLTVRTETERSLIGLFAGYVNGSVTNVGIGESSISVGAGTTALTEGDVFNMEYTISTYSLIGKYDEGNVVWVDKPTGGSGGEGDTGGSGAGWGGSLDMLQINKRLTYIYGALGSTTTLAPYAVSGFDVNALYGQKYSPYITRNTLIYLLKDTVIPLAIEQSVFDADEIDGFAFKNYAPIKTLPYYTSGATQEPTLLTNTGYIVGGGTTKAQSSIRVRADRPIGRSSTDLGIYKSLSTGYSTSDENQKFVGNNLQMLTIDARGNKYIIYDEYNQNAKTYVSANPGSYVGANYESINLKRYKEVRDSLVNTLDGQSLIHALHFMSKIDISNNLANLATTEADVKLLGKTIPGYEMIDGAINFSVEETGFITAVAGSYYSYSYKQSLFTVFSVSRNSAGKITKVEKISKIYEERKGEEVNYIYNTLLDSDKKSGYTYTLVYDIAYMNMLDVLGAAYYFEIPLNAGDYAIGCESGLSDSQDGVGAYLMYLDIGANGEASDDGGNDGPTIVPYHRMTAVTFVDSTAIANKTTNGYSVITFDVTLDPDKTGHKGLLLSFNRSSVDYISYRVDDPSSAFEVESIKDDANLTVDDGQNVTIADRSKKYYYYYRRREESA